MIDAVSYGQALYELSAESSVADAVRDQLLVICEALEREPSYRNLMDTPAVSSEEKCSLIKEAFAGAEELLCNFLCILCEKRSFYSLPACRRAFDAAYDEAHAILRATALTARPMEDRQKEALTKKLSAMTGKTVELDNQIDPTLVGGIRLRYGGVQLDDTIRSRLETLRRSLGDAIIS